MPWLLGTFPGAVLGISTLAWVAAAGVGVSLGLLGSGGSILAIPLLHGVVGLPFPVAKATSYPIVGLAAAAGALEAARRGALRWRAVLPFAGASVPAAFLAGRLLAPLVPARAQALGFAGLMLVAAWRMAFASVPPEGARARRSAPAVIAIGGVAGALTGLLGVGGGFLIVPALVLTLGFDVRAAIGASLLVIVLNCGASLVAHQLSAAAPVRWELAAAFSVVAVAGVFVGGRLARRLPAQRLRRTFAGVVAAMAIVLLATA